MDLAGLAVVIGVLVVSAWLGRRAAPMAKAVLWLSALVISAAMFLPSHVLRDVLGAGRLASVESAASSLSLTVADAMHFLAFLWLALMVWALRPDLRGWKLVVALAVLAVAGELMQGFTTERSPRVDDVVVNWIGAGIGLVLAKVSHVLWKILRFPHTREEEK